MNLLKALQGISPPDSADRGAGDEKSPSSSPSASVPPDGKENAGAGANEAERNAPSFNAMQSVLERHEAMANRVKNKQRTSPS